MVVRSTRDNFHDLKPFDQLKYIIKRLLKKEIYIPAAEKLSFRRNSNTLFLHFMVKRGFDGT